MIMYQTKLYQLGDFVAMIHTFIENFVGNQLKKFYKLSFFLGIKLIPFLFKIIMGWVCVQLASNKDYSKITAKSHCCRSMDAISSLILKQRWLKLIG